MQISSGGELLYASGTPVFTSGAQILGAAAQGMPLDHLALNPGSHRTVRVGETVLGLPLLRALWWVSLHVSPLRAVSQMAIACGSHGQRPHWFSRLDSGLRSWGAHCGVQTLWSSGRYFRFRIPTIVGCCARDGVYGEIVS